MATATEATEPTTHEAPQGAPTVSVTVKPPASKPFGQKQQSEEGAILQAIGSRPKDSWSVERLSAKGYPRATLGVLEVTVSGEDVRQGRLHAKLGSGTYKLVNLGDPKEQHVLPLGTQTPPQEFGTPGEDEEDEVVFVMPDGRPATARVRRGAVQSSVYAGGPAWGHQPWGGAPAQTDPVLKALLEGQSKLLEKMLDRMSEKRDDGPDAKTLIAIEQMKLEAAKEDAKSKAAVAKAEAEARVAEARIAADLRIAEFKAKSDADRDAARATAQIQADASKAVAAAQSEQAKAFAQAQERAAAAQLDAAKANAAAIVDAAKAKATGESGMFERLLKMQEDAKPERPPTILEQMGEIEQLKKFFAPPTADGIVAGLGAAKDAAVSVIGHLIALRQTPVKYVLVDAAGNPVGAQPPAVATVTLQSVTPNPPAGTLPPAAAAAMLTGTAGAPPAGAVPANAAEAKKVDDARALSREVLDGLRTLEDGAKRQVPAEAMARLIREKLPRVAEWLRSTTPDLILGQIGTIIEEPGAFSEAEKRSALACRATLAGDLVWLLTVLNAVKS